MRSIASRLFGPLFLAGVVVTGSGQAAVEERTGTFAGLEVRYRVIQPDDFDPAKTYPVVLHFAGGSQNWNIVERSTEADWRAGAEQRGYVVISPASPNGELYFEGADRIFPAFIEFILVTWRAEGGKLHVTGHSNGGLSAFHVASLYPQFFHSVTGYPGLLDGTSERRLGALRPLCLYMYVGDGDPGWLSAMQRQYRLLDGRGFNIGFAIEKGQVHRLDTRKAGLAGRIFEGLERARRGCS